MWWYAPIQKKNEPNLIFEHCVFLLCYMLICYVYALTVTYLWLLWTHIYFIFHVGLRSMLFRGFWKFQSLFRMYFIIEFKHRCASLKKVGNRRTMRMTTAFRKLTFSGIFATKPNMDFRKKLQVKQPELASCDWLACARLAWYWCVWNSYLC